MNIRVILFVQSAPSVLLALFVPLVLFYPNFLRHSQNRRAKRTRPRRRLQLCTHQSANCTAFVWKAFAAAAAMGGAPHDAHYPGYPTQVWSPTGGWWCHPKLWRRNTVFAFVGIFTVCVPIAIKSAQLEQRPLMPIRPIPSQMWCKNFGDPEEAKSD